MYAVKWPLPLCVLCADNDNSSSFLNLYKKNLGLVVMYCPQRIYRSHFSVFLLNILKDDSLFLWILDLCFVF
jgi:hypothetical protein